MVRHGGYHLRIQQYKFVYVGHNNTSIIQSKNIFKTMSVAIGIPVHGSSQELLNLLKNIYACEHPQIQTAEIIITNSGPKIDRKISELKLSIIEVPHHFYWSRSVETIYNHFHKSNASALILMNHDCLPKDDCFIKILDFHKNYPTSVGHVVLLNKAANDTIFWAGCRNEKFAAAFTEPYKGNSVMCLPKLPYSTTAAPAQCLILPKSTVRPKYLHAKLFPHYASDHVQTALLKKNGVPVLIIPNAFAYISLADRAKKCARMHPDTWKTFWDCLFAAYSPRYITVNFIAPFYTRTSFIEATLLSIKLGFGRIAKTLLERFKIIPPLQ